MTRILFVCFFSFSCASALYAQVTAASGIVRTQVAFLLVGGASPVADVYFESTARKVRVPVTASAAAKSALVAYEGPQSLVLLRPSTNKPGAAEELCQVVLPQASQVLVMIAPAPGTGNTGASSAYVAVAIDDDWKVFPAGTARFINYSGRKAAVRMDGKDTQLEKSSATPIRVVDVGAPIRQFEFHLATLEADVWSPAYKNKLKMSGKERITVVFLPSSRANGRGVQVTITSESSPAIISRPGAGAVAH